MAADHVLSIKDVHFSYEKGKEILHGVSADITPGKITALLGANGCGKSTLLNLIAGVQKPEKGKILVGGRDLKEMRRLDAARRIAAVHQNNTAPADMTVRKLVGAGRTPYRKLFGSFDESDEAAVHQALVDTETLEFSDRTISSLSGGQLQRVWLAMALAQDTEILLLDEITTYLDIHYQLEILHLIRRLNEKKNMTIVMVLHDMNQALTYCDEVIVMKEGQIAARGEIGTAVTETILDEAFGVSSSILEIGGMKHCIFRRKGETDV